MMDVLVGGCKNYGGYHYGEGAWSFLEINIFGGKMGEINKWPQDMVEIYILPTQEVEINIIQYWNNIYSLS